MGLDRGGEHELAVRDVLIHVLLKMVGQVQGSFLMAGGTEASLFTGKRDKLFFVTFRTADPGKAVFEITTLEEFVDHIVNDGTPISEILTVVDCISMVIPP